MDTSSAAIAELSASIGALAQGRAADEAPWLREVRESALRHAQTMRLPSTRDEDWKYTSVRAIERRGFALSPALQGAVTLDTLAGFGCGADAGVTAAFVDGRLVGLRGERPEGLAISSLGDALRERGAAVREILGQVTSAEVNGFAALNAAHLADGVYLHLAAGVQLEAPVNLVFAASGADGLAALPRNLLHLADGAAAHVVMHYVGLADGEYLTNTVTEIMLGEGATLELSSVQEESRKAYHVSTTDVYQAASSSFTSHAISIGARIARHDINTRLAAVGASVTLNGLYLATARQHVDFHTRTHHEQPRCTSRQFYKGVLDGHARGVFNGQVHVHEGAVGSDAEQANHNLLLSRNAEIDTKPQLEIYTDDVTCAHGATVGQLDDTMLFYLRSRGIPEPQARGLLTYGFAHDVVERLPLASLRERVEQVLMDVLPHGEQLKTLI